MARKWTGFVDQTTRDNGTVCTNAFLDIALNCKDASPEVRVNGFRQGEYSSMHDFVTATFTFTVRDTNGGYIGIDEVGVFLTPQQGRELCDKLQAALQKFNGGSTPPALGE